MRYDQAQGPCYARALVQGLWADEPYHLQIDSHMRFVEDWDTKALHMLRQCKEQTGHDRVLLSTYPPGYTLRDDKLSDHDDKLSDTCERKATLSDVPTPPFLCATKFKDGFLRFTGKPLAKEPARPLPCKFIAAGFVFGSSRYIAEVPYDPQLKCLFFGEEISIAVRLWTHGWDFFCPTTNLVYHLWSREHRPTFWEIFTEEFQEQQRSQAHVRDLLRGDTLASLSSPTSTDFGRFGLGDTRTLAAYCDFSGVDFRNETVSERAKLGGLAREDFAEERNRENVDLVMKLVAGGW